MEHQCFIGFLRDDQDDKTVVIIVPWYVRRTKTDMSQAKTVFNFIHVNCLMSVKMDFWIGFWEVDVNLSKIQSKEWTREIFREEKDFRRNTFWLFHYKTHRDCSSLSVTITVSVVYETSCDSRL